MLSNSKLPIDFGKFFKVLLIMTVLAVPPSPTNKTGDLISINFYKKKLYLKVYSVGTKILENNESSGGVYSNYVHLTHCLVPTKSNL